MAKKRRATLTDLLNELTAQVTYEKYKLVAMNAHEWGGLPETVKERHIERWLYQEGMAVFFRPKGFDYTVLRCQPVDGVNLQGEPKKYRASGLNGKTFELVEGRDEFVIIENNMNRIATDPFIMFYTNKITEAERTMDVNVKQQKTPTIICCDDKTLLTFKQIFSQVDGNVPAIYADKNLDLNAITSLDMKAKFLCNDLMDYKKAVENELLTFLGQNNVPVEKKERLITDEAQSNNQLIDSFAMLQLEARERACEEIKKVFGLNVTVKRRMEVEQNGSVLERDSVEQGQQSDRGTAGTGGKWRKRLGL